MSTNNKKYTAKNLRNLKSSEQFNKYSQEKLFPFGEDLTPAKTDAITPLFTAVSGVALGAIVNTIYNKLIAKKKRKWHENLGTAMMAGMLLGRASGEGYNFFKEKFGSAAKSTPDPVKPTMVGVTNSKGDKIHVQPEIAKNLQGDGFQQNNVYTDAQKQQKAKDIQTMPSVDYNKKWNSNIKPQVTIKPAQQQQTNSGHWTDAYKNNPNKVNTAKAEMDKQKLALDDLNNQVAQMESEMANLGNTPGEQYKKKQLNYQLYGLKEKQRSAQNKYNKMENGWKQLENLGYTPKQETPAPVEETKTPVKEKVVTPPVTPPVTETTQPISNEVRQILYPQFNYFGSSINNPYLNVFGSTYNNNANSYNFLGINPEQENEDDMEYLDWLHTF